VCEIAFVFCVSFLAGSKLAPPFGSLLISSENTLFGKKFILINWGVNGLE